MARRDWSRRNARSAAIGRNTELHIKEAAGGASWLVETEGKRSAPIGPFSELHIKTQGRIHNVDALCRGVNVMQIYF